MKNKLSKRSSANELYDMFIVPEKLIPYRNGFNITEGVNEIGFYENCFDILDIICNHKVNYEIEWWEFSRDHDNLFSLKAKNKQGEIFVDIKNLQSEFYFDDLVIIKRGKLLCLPIEENIY